MLKKVKRSFYLFFLTGIIKVQYDYALMVFALGDVKCFAIHSPGWLFTNRPLTWILV